MTLQQAMQQATAEIMADRAPKVYRGVHPNRKAHPVQHPYDINCGQCEEWAGRVEELVGDSVTVHDPDECHVFIEHGGKFYDAECPEGVTDWRRLPIFANKGRSRQEVTGLTDESYAAQPAYKFPARACADCEVEQGIMDRSDPNKSHGDCKRHWIARHLRDGFSMDQINAAIAEMSPTAFCPDLSAATVAEGAFDSIRTALFSANLVALADEAMTMVKPFHLSSALSQVENSASGSMSAVRQAAELIMQTDGPLFYKIQEQTQQHRMPQGTISKYLYLIHQKLLRKLHEYATTQTQQAEALVKALIS